MKKVVIFLWEYCPQMLFHSHSSAFEHMKPLISLSWSMDQSAMNCPTVFRNCKNRGFGTALPGVWGQPAFLFDQLVRVTHVCTILVLFVCCLCLRFGLGNVMAWFWSFFLRCCWFVICFCTNWCCFVVFMLSFLPCCFCWCASILSPILCLSCGWV